MVRGKKTLHYHYSFVEIKPENLILVAFKKAEASNDAILRFFETKGQRTRGEIILFRKPKSVKTVNLLEEDGEELKYRGRTIKLKVKPFEIVSLRITF